MTMVVASPASLIPMEHISGVAGSRARQHMVLQ
jgi:hypothetical protein